MNGLYVRACKKLKGFSLDIEWEIGNELAVLFGHSGAGKSMTLRMIAGIMEPEHGLIGHGETVYFDGSRKINVPPQRRPFGYVFQDLALFPHMTVKENILFGAGGLGKEEGRERALEMLRLFGLKDLEDRLPSEISGGQKQRVAFARALVRRPHILLLDEPFSALDSILRTEMGRLLKDIRAEFDIPVVLVTHDMFEAYALADRVIVYSEGKILESGPPEEVFGDPLCREAELLVKRTALSY